MHTRDLEWFRDNIAQPRMQQLFANTHIPDGFCCIDSLEIFYYDGRSCGTDSEVKASGYVYQNGRVERYTFAQCDMPLAAFAELHKDSIFISDGSLTIWNELEETEMKSRIRNLAFCSKLFPELSELTNLHIAFNCIEYLKMQHLYTAQSELSDQAHHHKPLDMSIRFAKDRAPAVSRLTETQIISDNCTR